ncbi:kappa-type opioid receptor-like [Asterias rubens]|uniref:kappa-type opioid receptor-like n=1 Tax=Asterias rubens TaxID=7604 RepID=UPI0014554ED0|nr:kappa-type opioid receptor-like [Asterias rubens]
MGSDATPEECSVLNTTNIAEETMSKWLYTHTDTIIITTVLPSILGLGLLSISLFLFVVFRISKLKSDTTVYLVHLSLADCFYLVAYVSYYLSFYVASPVALDLSFKHSVECCLSVVITYVGYMSSVALVTMMSFERYLALCHPLKHLKIRGRRRTNRMVALCWLVGFVVSCLMMPHAAVLKKLCLQWPEAALSSMPTLPSVITMCDPLHPSIHYFTTLLATIPWLLALVANFYMYIRIYHMLNKRRSFVGKGDADDRAIRVRNQVAKMLVVNGVVFFLCQAPYTGVSIIHVICFFFNLPSPIETTLGASARWIFSLPQIVNTIINPLIYGAMSSQYRSAFVQAFRCNVSPDDGRPRAQQQI